VQLEIRRATEQDAQARQALRPAASPPLAEAKGLPESAGPRDDAEKAVGLARPACANINILQQSASALRIHYQGNNGGKVTFFRRRRPINEAL